MKGVYILSSKNVNLNKDYTCKCEVKHTSVAMCQNQLLIPTVIATDADFASGQC